MERAFEACTLHFSSCTDREGLHPDLFWIERGWHPVCPTICVMFLASHQALLSGNSARRLMCAGGAAEYSVKSVQQIWSRCHIAAPTGEGKHRELHFTWSSHDLCRSDAACSSDGHIPAETENSSLHPTSSSWETIWMTRTRHFSENSRNVNSFSSKTICFWVESKQIPATCPFSAAQPLHFTQISLFFKNASTANVILQPFPLQLIKTASPTFHHFHYDQHKRLKF